MNVWKSGVLRIGCGPEMAEMEMRYDATNGPPTATDSAWPGGSAKYSQIYTADATRWGSAWSDCLYSVRVFERMRPATPVILCKETFARSLWTFVCIVYVIAAVDDDDDNDDNTMHDVSGLHHSDDIVYTTIVTYDCMSA